MTKQLFLLQLARINIGPSMLQSATFIIMSGVCMELGLSLLAFYPYPKVSPFFFPCCYCLGPLTFFHQLTRVKLRPLSSNSFSTSYSMSPVTYIGITSCWWKDTWGLSMSWRTLLTCNLVHQTLYSWLPWAGIVDMYCTRLVSPVGHPGIYGLLYFSHLPL